MADESLDANVSNNYLIEDGTFEEESSTANATVPSSGSRRSRFDRTYSCDECSFKTMKSKEFLNHQIEAHQKAFSVFSCNKCEYASRYKTKLERHRERRHGETKESHVTAASPARSFERGLESASGMHRRKSSVVSRVQSSPRKELPAAEDDGNVDEQNVEYSSQEQGLQETRSLTVIINGVTMHKCTRCAYASPIRLRTSKHYRQCHQITDDRYLCTTCSYRAQSRADFFSHRALHSEKEIFKCSDCGYITALKANLDRHYSHHLLDLPHKCTLCSFSSTGEGAIQRHMADHHTSSASFVHPSTAMECGEGGSSDVITVMSQIGKTTPELDVLKRPLSSGDSITPPGAAVSLGCGVCGHGTNSIDDMKTHLASVHGLTASGSRVSRLKISDRATVIDCVKEAKVDDVDAASAFPSSSRAKSASAESGIDAVVKASETDEAQVLNCRRCSYTAKWPSELKRHEMVHLVGKRYLCSDCNKSYKYASDLASHLRRVHSYRGGVSQLVPMHADADGSDSVVGRDKVQPARRSAASGQSRCQGTGARQNSSASNVRYVPKGRHKQLSWGGTRRCPACSFSTMFISRLDAHMRSHTHLKPFRCFYCDYASFWRGDVKKHMDKHHQPQMVGVEDAYELIEYTFQMDLRKAELNKSNADLAKESNDASTLPAPSLTKKGARRMKITPMRRWPVEGSPKALAEPSEASASAAALSRGVRPYKCSACGLRFNEVPDVQKHFHLAHTTVQDLKIIHLNRDDLIQLGESESEVEAYYPREPCSSAAREGGNAMLSKSKNDAGSQLARPFQCSACGKLSRWRSNMSKHVRTIHRGTPGVRIITRPAELRKQRDEFAVDKVKSVPEDDRALSCSACIYKSNSKVNIKKHIHRAHRGKAKIIVLHSAHETPEPSIRTVPDKPAAIKAQVSDHRPADAKTDALIVPMNPKDTTTKWSVAGFRCKLCGFISKWRSAVRRHIRTRHGKKNTVGLVKSIIIKPRIDRPPTVSPSARASTSTAHEAARMKGATRSAKAARSVANAPGAGVAASSVSGRTPGRLSTPGETLRTITRSEERMDGRRAVSESGMPTDNEGDVPITQCANAQHMTWLCCLCSFDCADRATAVDHLQAEHQLCAYRCSLCQFTSDAEAVIENHVLVEHEIQSLAEAVSKKWSRCLALLHVKTKESGFSCSTKHTFLPDDGRTIGIQYGCALCDMKTSWKSAVVRHTKEVHGRDPMKSKWPLDSVYKTIGSLPAWFSAGGSGAVPGLPTRLPKPPKHDPSVAVDSTITNDVGRDDGGATYSGGNSSVLPHGRKHSVKQQRSQSVAKSAVTLDGPKPKRQRIASESSANELDDQSLPIHDMQDIEEQNDSLRKTKNKAVDISIIMRRYQCSACPFRCKSTRDLIYHKQFHRPKSTATHKCPKCKYWVTRRGLLKQHTKVHDPKYAAQFTTGTSSGGAPASERGLQSPSSSSDGNTSPASDSGTEEASSMQCDSAVELAELKERVLNSRIQPVVLLLPIPPEQLRGGMDCEGLTLEHGRKKYKCNSCPYAAHFPSLLVRHEWMHERKRKALRAVMEAKRSGAAEIPSSRVTEHECNLCDFACDDRRILEQHLYVHSLDYPGFVDDEITPELAKEMQHLAEQASDGAELVSSEGGFNLKYNHNSGEYVLEGNGNVTRYQCEKCPYRTFNMEHFRRHVVLHGCRQRYACRYCDYSVPVFSMVTRHQQLHTSINPNLLTTVKPSNLPLLSFTSADKALLGDTACDPADDFYEHRPEDSVAPLESFDTAAKKKLYRCDFCPYANIRKDHIVSHLKCHYIRSHFKCVYCTYSASKACLINEHIKLHHVPFVGPNGNTLPIVLDGETGGADCVKLVPSSEMEREYIDISEMQSEAANETSKETELELRSCDRMRPVSGLEVRTCNDLVCQYCDRRFDSADDHHDHELRHLVSMVRVNDDSDEET